LSTGEGNSLKNDFPSLITAWPEIAVPEGKKNQDMGNHAWGTSYLKKGKPWPRSAKLCPKIELEGGTRQNLRGKHMVSEPPLESYQYSRRWGCPKFENRIKRNFETSKELLDRVSVIGIYNKSRKEISRWDGGSGNAILKHVKPAWSVKGIVRTGVQTPNEEGHQC